MQADARINEFHYDNISTDVNEFVEIFIPNPQPSDLSEYQIVLYRGDGTSYDEISLDMTTVTSDAGGSYYVWETTLQNGTSGIALSGNCGLIEFLSYEGTVTASEGIADGVESIDIGVEQSNSTTPEQSSIQLIDSDWVLTEGFNTKGTENAVPPCEITNATIQNAGCQGEDYVFEVIFDASNSSGDFEVFDVTSSMVLSSGMTSPIEVTLTGNTSTTPFNIIVRDAGDNTCASSEVEVTPEDCTPPCEITNVTIQNAGCQNLDYVFEVAFDASNSSNSFEVINADDNTVLASGTASPIEVTLANNSSTTPINIAIRDANNNACQSASVEVAPEDCVSTCMQADARINEFHYDNISTDVNEFVEIFIPNPQPSDLSEYQIVLYRGDGTSYDEITLDMTTVTSDASGSYYVWETTLQNGTSGIALSGNCSLIEFLSYEGTVTASEGIADGVESIDIGVEQSNSTTPEQSSIQLIGSDWVLTEAFNTKGAENALPPCEITNVAIQNTGCQGEDYIFEVIFDVSNSSGDFEVFDVTNNMVLASGTASPIEVTLASNISTTPFNIIIRDASDNTCASEEVEVIPEDCTLPCEQAMARINEFHYDNISTDVNEFVEVFIPNPQPSDLDQYQIVLYNGDDGMNYREITLDMTTVTSDALGSYYVWETSLQNGAPDGIALAGPCELIEFLSYEGTFTAIGGIADGVESTDVGVEQSTSTTPEQSSIQLIDDDWVLTLGFNTKGAVNALPACEITNVLIQNAECQGEDYVFEVSFQVMDGSGGYEVINADDDSILASGDASPIAVTLEGNTSTTPFNIAVRDANNTDCVSESVAITPEDCTPLVCEIANVSIQNADCQDTDFVFEVAFEAFNSSGSFEVVNAKDNSVLATSDASPITVTLIGNTSTEAFNIFVRDANDNTCVSDEVEVIPEDCSPLVCSNVGDLVITEIIQNPSAVLDTDGEWFEVYNSTDTPIDLKGYIIRDAGGENHEIATSVIVPNNGYVVLARNADQNANGGVVADYEYDGFTLGNMDDEVIIECNGVVIDSVGYDDGATFPNPTGASMSLNPNNLNATDNDNGANWCEASSTYGDGDLGTPGTVNDACPVCMISNIGIQNGACQGTNYVFEVTFDVENGSGTYEVVNAVDNSILATGDASPITVTLIG
ncbi:MAG: lamin tail domain-containing protein, partial [Bacteroidota bacterium]